jgi:hypothetical protein
MSTIVTQDQLHRKVRQELVITIIVSRSQEYFPNFSSVAFVARGLCYFFLSGLEYNVRI